MTSREDRHLHWEAQQGPEVDGGVAGEGLQFVAEAFVDGLPAIQAMGQQQVGPDTAPGGERQLQQACGLQEGRGVRGEEGREIAQTRQLRMKAAGDLVCAIPNVHRDRPFGGWGFDGWGLDLCDYDLLYMIYARRRSQKFLCVPQFQLFFMFFRMFIFERLH
jgi:hypothetical protein